MIGLLDEQIKHDDYYERIMRLTTYIVDIMSPQLNDNIYILDPFLEPFSTVYIPFMKKKYEDYLWSKVINELCGYMLVGKIKILTKKKIEDLHNVLMVNSKTYPVILPNLEFPNCNIQIARYDGTDNVPNQLHDRWILKVGNDCNNTGLHVGPSLNDIWGKDVTITLFDKDTFEKAVSRFKYIWFIAVQRRII